MTLSKSKLRKVRLRKEANAETTLKNTQRAYWNRMIFGSRKGLRRAIHLRQNCML